MILPGSHIMAHEGHTYNWFVGDAVSPQQEPANKRNPSIFWAFGMLEGWNTLNAVYGAKFNMNTREIYEITKLPK